MVQRAPARCRAVAEAGQMEFHAHACKAPEGALEPFGYDPGKLAAHDVEVEVSHCGICHSDVHLIDNDWGVNRYPLVPGHEVVGLVSAVGSKVKGLRVGQRVGIGWQRTSCGRCEHCRAGDENVCTRMEATCVGHFGGFADRIRIDERFAFAIPAALDSAHAAPLMCAGVTVYAPLARYGVGKGMRVGVLGVGGLGHLAVQFASRMGAEVVALSSSPDKSAEARSFGAEQFLETGDPARLRRERRTLDLLLNTVSAPVEYPDFLGMLKPGGTLCLVGAPREPIVIPTAALIGGQKAVSGSSIGGSRAMREMLEFAARHEVRARIQTLPMDQCNLGVAKVRRNQARYRIVLQN
jgi:uncharacterized zinc-type alcohol dehydrogenase-like protein